MALWKVGTSAGPRWALGPADDGPRDLLAADVRLDTLLAAGGTGTNWTSIGDRVVGPVPPDAVLLAPADSQEVWAAGVTYRRSLDARVHESDTPDSYDRVYTATRPELFFKAAPGRTRGPDEQVCVRADSAWNVPEPELALVIDASGRIVAYTIGNDMSSRSIEGENPLYLPQAKIYTGSCAIGPCLVPVNEAPATVDMDIELVVVRGDRPVVRDTVRVADLRRGTEELAGWLFTALDFPVGVLLLTGTATVPDPAFTLAEGDEVRIAISGLGELRNRVVTLACRN